MPEIHHGVVAPAVNRISNVVRNAAHGGRSHAHHVVVTPARWALESSDNGTHVPYTTRSASQKFPKMSSAHVSESQVAGRAGQLVRLLREMESVAVAWSGGVDSAVVAKAAAVALGDRAVAVTALSPSLADAERQIAAQEALAIGIRHLEIATEEFSREEYRRNSGDRCFFCKDTLYSLMKNRMAEFSFSVLVNGANTDDLGDHRPGMQAAKDHDVRSPLIELGIDKSGVRELARYWGLSVAEKPASPCLSSRIAYGVEVTEDRVRRVELAEAWLRDNAGLSEFRVRCEAGELARIEVPVMQLLALVQDPMRGQLVQRLTKLGFRNVTVDLQGFRSGSLNDALVQLGDA